jgi:hypothetical protein
MTAVLLTYGADVFAAVASVLAAVLIHERRHHRGAQPAHRAPRRDPHDPVIGGSVHTRWILGQDEPKDDDR